MPFLAVYTPVNPGFTDQPWLLPGAFPMSSQVGRTFVLLSLVSLLGFVASAVALLTHKEWWPAVAVVAAVISLVVLLPWWSSWPTQIRNADAIVDVLVIVLFTLWGGQIARALP